VFFSAILYYSLNDSLLQDFDNALYNYSIDVSKNVETGFTSDLLFPVLTVNQNKIFPFSSGNSFILIRHVSGRIISQTGNFGKLEFPYKDEIDKVLKGADSSYTTLQDTKAIPDPEADMYRLITFPLDNEPSPQLFLQIAVPMTTFETQLERLTNIIAIGLPALLLLAVFLGLYFSSRALRPVQELIKNTDKIDMNHLSERVPLPEARDEIRKLAETQNLMLNRIEKAFLSQERFIADASHQLLTPLTILRGELEIQRKNDVKNQDLFNSLLQEVDSLSKIVKDMLLLARIDAGGDVINFRNLEVEEILLEVIERLQKATLEKNIHIKIEIKELAEKKPISGEPDLLYNLFYNIIENAIKYSFEKQTIFITITWLEDETLIDIIDSGIGIPPEKMTTIFDRFSRVNPSGKTKGFGLGLSIAKKIADLHSFELKIMPRPSETAPKGAHFQIKMKHSAQI
jgi:signal transduction histidine kinase